MIASPCVWRLATAALLTVGVASCTSLRVQLFTAGLSQAQINKVSEALKDEGYKVHLNDLPVPEAVRFPTLVYYPVRNDPSQVRRLVALLDELGYRVDMSPVSAGNHFYTSGNVGIYLEPYKPVARVATLSGKDFTGVCPQVDADLTLNSDSTFRLDVERWNASRQREDVIATMSGRWRKSDHGVVLDMDGQDVSYELTHTLRRPYFVS